jgi:oxygen-independent coproporphyrinogen III oxidase
MTGLLEGSPYVGYAYAYPHKAAYRRLDPPVPLREAWRSEDRGAVFLYLHVPFCEMRCGFCNLFTTANPVEGMPAQYLRALEREADAAREAIGRLRVARMAIGGGTPTFLDPAELHRLFDLAAAFDADPRRVPTSVETSPQTALPERLAVLRERGVRRISIGVQSFDEEEVRAAGRPQRTADVHRALERIRDAGFPLLNVDLIYGLPGQTVESWLRSVRQVLTYRPEELYLYPLYVRPLTGLGRTGARTWDQQRLDSYRTARDLLRCSGYRQVSMRMFRLAGCAEAPDAPEYCCQSDGMLGLGCGARSYTAALHYSTEYAVGRQGVGEILFDYVARSGKEFSHARWGFRLNQEERRRRYVLKSLLQAEGLSLGAYERHFGSGAVEDLPQLLDLLGEGLAQRRGDRLCLTESGLERSDAIGPWLYSAAASALSEAAVLR